MASRPRSDTNGPRRTAPEGKVQRPQTAAGSGREVRFVDLSRLLLDDKNPRFGNSSTARSQDEIVRYIVDKFGVDDVLSSLAINGYLAAEPLVCRPGPGKSFIVAEGNRRLAACLILGDDPRGKGFQSRLSSFSDDQLAWAKSEVQSLPVITFDDASDQIKLLSYLGVKHISSAQPWDSYAKAAWVAAVVRERKLEVTSVMAMLGDENRTIPRLLEGYYFIDQLERAGSFVPKNSVRRGRGSVTEYPFSWVYTVLGYSTTRTFLDLPSAAQTASDPVAVRKLDDAALVVYSMFGDSSRGRNSAVSDSRELGELAAAFASPEKVDLLRQGKSVNEISEVTKPIEQRFRDGLARVREIHRNLIATIGEQKLPSVVAASLVEPARRNQQSGASILRSLQDIAGADNDE